MLKNKYQYMIEILVYYHTREDKLNITARDQRSKCDLTDNTCFLRILQCKIKYCQLQAEKKRHTIGL